MVSYTSFAFMNMLKILMLVMVPGKVIHIYIAKNFDVEVVGINLSIITRE